MNNCDILKKLISNLSILKDLDNNLIQISQSSSHTNGDYQTNIALKNFKNVRNKLDIKKPIEYANIIVEELKNTKNNIIQDVSSSIPGFINISLSDEFIIKQALTDKVIDLVNNNTIIDYSSPNIAKEMHVGHLRSTIIGDVISNMLERTGESVTRINHIGDWGTQFGMLIQYLRHNNIDVFSSDICLSDLHKWYKESKKMFDDDSIFNEESHQRVVELQSGNDTCIEIWKKLCDISESSYNDIYNRLGVSNKLKVMGESFYNKYLDSVVDELSNKGLLIDEDGAKLMFPIKGKIPLIVRKSDGGYGYDTTDLAAIRYRINELKANKIIYVTDSGQSLHFELIFEAAKKAGWANNVEFKHVGFGVVLGEDGKRIKSRSGDTIKLRDLIGEANDKFYESNKERLESGNGQINSDDLLDLSKIIGSCAIKYADLKQNRNNNYQFSYEKMLDHRGDTVIYQLYSWVRINNIFEKTNKSIGKINITCELDRDIIMHLSQYDEIIEKSCDLLLPNYICEYLYYLSTKVNEYWNNYKILGNENEESMLALLHIIKQYMSRCFSILGIDANKIKNL